MYGGVLDLIGLGFIINIGNQHCQLHVGMLSGAVTIGTIMWDSNTNTTIIQDIIASGKDISSVIASLNKQAYQYLGRAQILLIVGGLSSVFAVVSYFERKKAQKVNEIRSAARMKLESYSEENQPKIYCIACQDAVKEIICLPCKHVVCCLDCWGAIRNKTKCMVCNRAITGRATWMDA